MALTTSSRFTRVDIRCAGTNYMQPIVVRYTLDETPPFGGSISLVGGSHTSPFISDAARVKLAILQAINASSAGFRDAAGNSIAVKVYNLIGDRDATQDELEEFGSFNPLIAGSYEKWRNSQRIDGILAYQSDYAKDASTGEASLAIPARLSTKSFIPTGGTYNVGLSILDFVPVNSRSFRFELNIPETDGVTPSTFNDYRPLRAFHQWMVDHYVAGTGVGAVGNPVAALNSYTGGRHFSVEFAPNNAKVFTVTQMAYGLAAGTPNVFFWSANFQLVSSTATYSTTEIESYLATTLQSIPATGLATTTLLGSASQPLAAQSVDFGNGRELLVERGAPIIQIKDPGDTVPRKIILGNDRAANITTLTTHSSGAYLIPAPHEKALVNTIHVGPGLTAGVTLRMQTPPLMAGLMFNHRRVAIHNRDSLYPLPIVDWNGVVRITLSPGQQCVLSFSSHDDGGGEVFGASIPQRRMIATAGTLGPLSDMNYYAAGTTQWARPCPTPPVASYEVLDSDAFDIGSSTFTDATLLAASSFAHTVADVQNEAERRDAL